MLRFERPILAASRRVPQGRLATCKRPNAILILAARRRVLQANWPSRASLRLSPTSGEDLSSVLRCIVVRGHLT